MSSDGEQRETPSSPVKSGPSVRSASPAKRSRADMEGEEKAAQSVPGSFGREEANTTVTDFDEAMQGMTPVGSGEADTQATGESMETSAQESMTTNTSSTSLHSEELPAYSAEDSGPQKGSNKPSIDEQEKTLSELQQEPLDEGQRGFVVSKKWLDRVKSRSSQGLQNTTYPKEAREGDIGPIDNSDVVPDGAFASAHVVDANKKEYIPLKPGLSLGEDYELLSEKAWGRLISWYGMAASQKQIIRYAHNTAPPDATAPNIMYDMYPPVFTIRKVPQSEVPPRRPTSSYESLIKRKEGKLYGQLSPDDAIRLVSSRSEKFQHFLRRAKEIADIPFSTKVKIWRVGKASNAVAKGNPSGVLSPPHSRSTSPNAEQPRPKLVIDAATFNNMEECELVDGKDETGNSNYNGSSTMDMYQLFEDADLVLEEQIGGGTDGKYASDSKPKHTIKLGLPGRSTGSKAPSAAPSRGVSPAPGGMMTRGRQRKDGRTRGTVGLSNLGNTCYMNSALQCIRSVEELATYFLSGKYKSEINAGNPLGHGGVMAKQYANLLSSIYGENAGGSFTPSNFKKTLGSLQPMFSGYGQQDSQEFLSFLVDAIHEDLNRIIKKPYNENPDSDDNTVHDPQAIIELGETYRANHRARNESIAMDLFNGFYKNTMECPDCGKISITFDPFSLVTVQLPIESTFTHTYTFVPLSGRPINHDIDFDKNGSLKALKEYIASKHPGVEADRLWMAEVYNNKIYRVFDNSSTVQEAHIQPSDHIFFFELAEVPSNPPVVSKAKKYHGYNMMSNNTDEDVPEMDDPKADRFAVPIFMRQKSRNGTGFQWTMHPMYIIVSREEAQNYDCILKKTLVAASRLTSASMLTELENANDIHDVTDDTKEDEDAGGAADEKALSDRSTSEDDYVKIPRPANNSNQQNGEGEVAMTNGDANTEDRPLPQGFMEAQYVLSSALRNQVFGLKYGKAKEGLHCTGMGSVEERTIAPMSERVKQSARRGSSDSGTSSDESTTSTASGADANGEHETQESDAEIEDKPDIVIGEQTEDTVGLPTPNGHGDESDELPDDPLVSRKPGSKRGQKQFRGKNKGRKGKQRGYGKKDRQRGKQQQSNGGGRFHQYGGKSLPKAEDPEDNPYYIKLGEAIVLDWYPEAFDHYFGGDKADEDGKRGHFISHESGTKNIDVFPDELMQKKRVKRTDRKKNGVSLDECFLETGKREVLSEDNAWYCGRCKELRRATKTLEIWTIPDILVVHLKRFGGNRSFRDKIDILVDYPIEGLDMTDRVGHKEDGKEYVYDLFAVDNHYGGLGGGHYTAYAKNFYDGQWYDYNDASCTKLSDRTLHANAAAYLLFYRRRSNTPLGPQYLQDLVNEARNPPPATDNEDAADDSDSGEGRLGGRLNGSLRSSGGWNGAGALGAASAAATGNGGILGAKQEVGSSQTTRGTEMSEDGRPFSGPKGLTQPQVGWNFASIDGQGDAAEDEGGSDAESLAGNPDQDDDGDARMDDSLPSLDPTGDWPNSAGAGTPELPDGMEFSDDHHLYSGGRGNEYDDGTLHLENAGYDHEDAASDATYEIKSPSGSGMDSEGVDKDKLS